MASTKKMDEARGAVVVAARYTVEDAEVMADGSYRVSAAQMAELKAASDAYQNETDAWYVQAGVEATRYLAEIRARATA